MILVDGCTACAKMSYNFSDISFIYPITPSSPMASYIDNLSSKNVKNIFNDTVDVVEMQSEAGAAGALHGALSAGLLGSSFTASQGLLLMMPNMYKMAGEMLPAVIHVAARSLATHALSIFGDHQDIYAARTTGFCMLASTNVQDAYNLALVAHLSAIKGSLPFLHFFDGFRTSHEYNLIEEIPKEELLRLIDYDKIKEFRKRSLNTEKSITRGTNQNEDIYFQSVEARNSDYLKIPDIVNEYMIKVNKITGKDYKPFNYYGPNKAKYIIVAMGSVCDTIKKVVLHKNNIDFGLIEVHLYRPFSLDYFLKVLPTSVKKIAVLDRTKENSSIGEPLYLDIVAALANSDIKIYGGRYGLSSKNTSVNDIYDVFMNLKNEPKHNFTVGICDDVTNTNLKHYEYDFTDNFKEFKIYGFGSDGMVSASKNLLEILSKNNCVQGYFEYDSKKSGGITVSHLRLDDKIIKAPYYVEKPELVVVTKDEYFYKFDVIKGIVKNGILLINTNKNPEEINRFLPDKIKKELRDKDINVYIIDAENLSIKNNIKGKISLIMESAILDLLKINDFKSMLIEDIKERFITKGEEIVNANINCVNEYSNYLMNVKIDEAPGIIIEDDNKVFNLISKRQGGNLKVSELLDYKDGTFPGGMSFKEKRKMSLYVPKWDKEKCIECGMCSMVCPHAVVRPFILENTTKLNAKDSIEGDCKYLISVSEADCTGCGLCINTCPAKALSFGTFEQEKQDIADELFNNYNNPIRPLNNIKNIQLRKPLFEFSGACAGCGETPYIKLLTQIVGEKLVIANATGCSSIYGGACTSTPYKVSWSNSLFEDNAEFGFGILSSYDKMRERIKNELSLCDAKEAQELLTKYVENYDDYEKIKEIKEDIKKFVSEDLYEYILPKSVWTIGGDGWAYDIGFGGIDHVLSNNKNAKILVLDTELYSNTGGQASKSSHEGAVLEFANNGKKTRKKDLFKIAMSYPNIYVAQISMGANMMHTINVLKEAEKHVGPAIIIAYCPCVEHGISGGLINSIKEERLAVESGYMILMRYFDNKLFIDSREPNFDKYDEFLNNEVRYRALKIKDKKTADILLELNKNSAIDRYNYYKKLLK